MPAVAKASLMLWNWEVMDWRASGMRPSGNIEGVVEVEVVFVEVVLVAVSVPFLCSACGGRAGWGAVSG